MRFALLSAAVTMLGFAGIANAEYRCSPCDQGGLQVCGDWDSVNHQWNSTQQVSCNGGGGGPVTEYRCSPCDQSGVQVCGQWDSENHYWVSTEQVLCR